MEKIKSRRFIFTALAKLAGVYLILNGDPETGALLIGAAGGTYNIGQSMEDAAKAKARELVSKYVELD